MYAVGDDLDVHAVEQIRSLHRSAVTPAADAPRHRHGRVEMRHQPEAAFLKGGYHVLGEAVGMADARQDSVRDEISSELGGAGKFGRYRHAPDLVRDGQQLSVLLRLRVADISFVHRTLL